MRLGVARGLAIAGVLLNVAGFTLWARSGFRPGSYVFMIGPLGMVAFLVAGATQLAAGTFLAVRRPDLPLGLLTLVFSIAASLGTAAIGYIAWVDAGNVGPWQPAWVAWLTTVAGFGTAAVSAIALGHAFPDGHVARRWRPFLAVAVLGALVISLVFAVRPGPIFLFPGYDNPLAVDASLDLPLGAVLVVGLGLLLVGAASVAMALVERYRGGDASLRAQLRWYLTTAVLLVLGFNAFLAALGVLPPGSPLGEAVLVGFILSAGLPPIAIFVAISRYRLFDIDRILSRTFVFGTLTAILAGVYTASIRLFNSIFTLVTGEESEAALVITTLVIAASFTPIKRRLEGFVERRFRDPGAGSAGSSPALAAGEPVPTETTLDDAAISRIAAAIAANPDFVAAVATRVPDGSAGTEATGSTEAADEAGVDESES